MADLLFHRGVVLDGTLAQTDGQARELWCSREGISESLGATGFPHKNDVALPWQRSSPSAPSSKPSLAREYPDFELCLFGHIGDGNLHVNVMKPQGARPQPEFLRRTKTADRDLFMLVQKHRGSISAEARRGPDQEGVPSLQPRAPEEMGPAPGDQANPRSPRNPEPW